MVVEKAPRDIVLGLSFRRRFDLAFPAAFRPAQGSGVTHVCLGVPPGHGVCFPRVLRDKPFYAGKDPSATPFRQVLALDTTWQRWPLTGKVVAPQHFRAMLSARY
jgi:hypothetical protein